MPLCFLLIMKKMCSFNVFSPVPILVFHLSKSVNKHINKRVCVLCVSLRTLTSGLLNNAALCQMPLLPDNILISDSRFENVNAFNAVTPHPCQTVENSRTEDVHI